MKFNNIVVDHTEIKQSYLDIDDKTRVNPFSWAGQFSPQFIEIIIDKYATESDVIFDPFSGSGTVLVESARKNIAACGVELNPSAYYMSKFYEICCLNKKNRMEIINKIDDILSSLIISKNIEETLLSACNEESNHYIKNTLALLVITIDVYKNGFDLIVVGTKWNKIKKMIIDLPYSTNAINSILGDIRNVDVPSNFASLIITSPPYINVFNYHQNYRRSVEKLGYDVLTTAKSEFGSNRKNRGNRFLTVIQYTIDMALAIKECIRIAKNGSRMIFVVGRESSILSTKFCNSEIIYRIEKEIFGMNFILIQERSFKNRFGQMIFEDIIHFKVNDCSKTITNDDEIIAYARSIAQEMLENALQSVDNDKRDLINAALEKCSKIRQSEILQ